MDIFEVLTAISKKKKAFVNNGINETEALLKAELDVSKDYPSCSYISSIIAHAKQFNKDIFLLNQDYDYSP